MARITTQTALDHAFNIRRDVFIIEQGVPETLEFDAFDRLDSGCEHVLMTYNGSPAATGRVRKIDTCAKLERICVRKSYRGFGLGKQVIHQLEAVIKNEHVDHYLLHGQTHAIGFYESLGYTVFSDVFIEDGIPHVKMKKNLSHVAN